MDNQLLREKLNTQTTENRALKKSNKAFQDRIDELEELLSSANKRNGMTKSLCGKQLLKKVRTQ